MTPTYTSFILTSTFPLPNLYPASDAEARTALAARGHDTTKFDGLSGLVAAAKMSEEQVTKSFEFTSELNQAKHDYAMLKITLATEKQRCESLDLLMAAKDAKIVELDGVLKASSAQLLENHRKITAMDLELAQIRTQIAHETKIRETLVQSAINEAESKSAPIESIYDLFDSASLHTRFNS